MPMKLSLMSLTTVTWWTNFLPLMVIGISKTPKEFIFDLLAATYPFPFWTSLGLMFLNAFQKLFAFMQVMAAPVLKSQLKVISPVVTLILGCFFPMKRHHDFTHLLQVAIETAHKLIIICGMTKGAWRRGSIKLRGENPGGLGPGRHSGWSCWLLNWPWTRKSSCLYPDMVCLRQYAFNNPLGGDSEFCRRHKFV